MKKELTRERIEELASKIKQNTATAAEQREFDAWYGRQAEKPFHVPGHVATSETDLKDGIYQHILQETGLNKPNRPRLMLWRRIAVAASVVLCLSVGGYFFLNKKPDTVQTVQNQQVDFAPGSNKAILTLSNGKKIALDDVSQGKLAAEGSTVISKTGDGQVIYDDQHSLHSKTENVVNTMSTPRGGQYHLTLSDGTEVWLNAASSITYPAAFTGSDRQVKITGEVYFQVAHNATKPFRVKSNGQMVEVLGTHFNINAYNDEVAVKTTLLEGSVRISPLRGDKADEATSAILKPGQQAILSSGALSTKSVDVNEAMAWKNGYFYFVDTDIQTIMRQISRWYDVDVEFQGPITKETFTGRISRNRNISKVLKIVQDSKYVQLTFEGRRIMVKM